MILTFLMMAVLLIACVSLLFIPWQSQDSISRDQLNNLIYQQRLQELEQESSLSDSQQQTMLVTDLQRNLLEDIPVTLKNKSTPGNDWIYLPGVIILSLLTFGMFFKTTSIKQVDEWLQVTTQTPQLIQRALSADARSLSQEDLARLALGLRTRLAQYPDNLSGWMLLERVGMALNNFTLASQAVERAYQLAPENNKVKISYAEVLSHSPHPADNLRAGILLNELLKEDHTNIQVLSLLSFHAFGQQNYQQAIAAWQMMLRLLPADDNRRPLIERSISQAEQQITAG
ncbi:c-type cytochrome biogenesis protein CcmI [Enterobacteriaceae bacterium ESL0689]|nr:c-type cytochrome biogenesis protein CcmI [Enterobacteriaceae bacterium ESL0689]